MVVGARGGEKYWYNGIDRIDSALGYIEGNVQPCCKEANLAKLNMSEEDFLQLIREIHSHRGLNG